MGVSSSSGASPYKAIPQRTMSRCVSGMRNIAAELGCMADRRSQVLVVKRLEQCCKTVELYVRKRQIRVGTWRSA